MSNGFEDFVPEGQDAGPAGAGYTDFIPGPTPEELAAKEEEKRLSKEAEAQAAEAPVKKTKKAKKK